MIICIDILYGIILITFRKSLIGFFNLGESDIINDAITYLVIISFGIILIELKVGSNWSI